MGESVIKWEVGKPAERGVYLVTVNGRFVATDSYGLNCGWQIWPGKVTAWCKISDIKPYKEE